MAQARAEQGGNVKGRRTRIIPFWDELDPEAATTIPRDLVGYRRYIVDVRWPDGSTVAAITERALLEDPQFIQQRMMGVGVIETERNLCKA